MESIKKYISLEKIIFIIVLMVAIFIRVYKIDKIPHGINVDEAGMAYDAFCLANYGTDRYLNKLPIYLINFGGGQSALYAYLASFLIKIFGFSLTIIRMPAVILGLIAIILAYLMTREKLGVKYALTFMALISICPWHIMASRWGLDCNLLAPMSIISLFFLLRAKSTLDYTIAGISFGLTLYTYALSYIILPIFLSISLIYMLHTKEIQFKNVIIMGIPIFLLAIPLILMLLINNGHISEIESFITIPKLWNYRGSEISLSNIKDNIGFIKIVFANDHLVYNSLPEYGTIYEFALFLAVFGFFVEIDKLFKNIKNKKFDIGALMLFLFIAGMICMLIIKKPNINKANVVFIPLLFFTCTTIRIVYKNYRVFFYIIVCLYVISFYGFANFYFNTYPLKYENQPFFESDLNYVLNYLQNDVRFIGKDIYINTDTVQPYIYTLINNRISPYEFNDNRHNKKNDYMSYGNYYFNNYNIMNDVVYIIENDDEFIKQLKDNNYKTENLKNMIIAYK